MKVNDFTFRYFILLLILLFLLNGCSKKKEDTILLSVNQDFLKYEVENLSAYTADEEGALYTAANSFFKEDNSLESIPTYINKYDLEGNLVFSHEFDSSIYAISSMAVNDNKVYFTALGNNKSGVYYSLYSYDIEKDNLEMLCDFDDFDRINQLVFHDNRVYVLGNKYTTNNSLSHSTKTSKSEGKRILYYSLNDKKKYDLGVNIPISMAKNEDETLMINGFLEDEGYCMLKYDPDKDTVKVVANFSYGKFENFAVCDNGKKIMYTYGKNPRGLVMSEIADINEEAELYPDANNFNYDIYYISGQVFCMNYEKDIVRFSLDTMLRDNRTIRYISSGFQVDEPFGCGYSMIREELEDDKFALKVLAQDKDYDLCIMNTSSYNSYDIYRNGVFYPLNDVSGIYEYLDSCFPYVKDAATDQDGNIWMIPIGVDIRGLLVNEDSLESNHINLKNNMTYEEFYQAQDSITYELNRMTNCNSLVVYLSFFAQYFNKQIDLKPNEIKSKLELFQKYYSQMPSMLNSNIDVNGDFYYTYCRDSNSYELILQKISNDNNLEFYSMPKLNTSDKNIGTCTFLAVNTNSKNREDALAYIEDWIKFRMEQEQVPLYFKQPIPQENTLRRSLYELYENGEITFYIDRDVYEKGFFDVIENGSNIDDYIKETQRKLNTYFNE